MSEAYLDIIIVEDSEKHAKGMEEAYSKAVAVMKKKEILKECLGLDKVTVRWEKGTKAETVRNGEKFFFYEEEIIEKLAKIISENNRKSICTGILLDVSLSKEEYEKASVNDYSGFTLARKIYEKFDEKAGIYIVTSIREFGPQVMRLMGTRELIRRYVSKDLVTEYLSYGVVARTIYYMFRREALDERKEDSIDGLCESD